MAKESIDALINGGKASAAPPLGPALGPLGVNIGEVVAEINKKTASFTGMQVPVKVIVDTETKTFEISIGTPPASALIKKEAGIQKAAGNPKEEFVADLAIEQVIKIAGMKSDALLGKGTKEKVREIAGTCQSMGVMIEGKPAAESLKDIAAGMFDEKIKSGKTELSEEEKKELAAEKKRLEEDLRLKRDKYVAQAKDILKQLEGKDPKDIKKKMAEAKIPMPIINELVVEEKKEPAKK